MASGIPHSSTFSGLTQKVIVYGEAFEGVIARAKQGPLTPADWAPLDALVDPARWERVGVFLGPEVQTIGWDQYKAIITQYGAMTTWDGTLRRITEAENAVIQELVETNTSQGRTSLANTVTVFEFDGAGRIVHLDVYVNHLEYRPA